MNEEVSEKKPRGNPNWKKKEAQVGVDAGKWIDPNAKPLPSFTTTETVESVKYNDSVIWTMLMQTAMQNWEAKTEDIVSRAAVVADIALKKYKDRFK